MTKSTKKPATFRLSGSIRFNLELLSKRHDASQADIISALVYCMYHDYEDKFHEVIEILEKKRVLD